MLTLNYFTIWDHWMISQLFDERLGMVWIGWMKQTRPRLRASCCWDLNFHHNPLCSRWTSSLQRLLPLDFIRSEEEIVVVLSLRLPTLLSPLRLKEQLVVQFLLGLLRQIGNFYGFSPRHLLKWNPLVRQPGNKIFLKLFVVPCCGATITMPATACYNLAKLTFISSAWGVKGQLKYVFIALELEAKFAISTEKGQTKFCNMKENIFIHWYFSDEGGREGILENGIQTLTGPQESTLAEPAGFHFHLFLC